MTEPRMPLRFSPLLKKKVWGGSRLGAPNATAPIGESWELVSLPDNESVVANGELTGTTLGELVATHGKLLLGRASRANDRFPLLLKFLDAAETLSMQVHPRRTAGQDNADAKDEAWVVIDAEPNAVIYSGFEHDVTEDDVLAAIEADTLPSLVKTHAAIPGRCFTLPSGTIHALGAGVLVAEVQTPSDVTYRLHDWGRTGLDGQPRALHVSDALANMSTSAATSDPWTDGDEDDPLCRTPHFAIVQRRFDSGAAIVRGEANTCRAWMVVGGSAQVSTDDATFSVGPLQTVLIPAACHGFALSVRDKLTVLEVAPGAE